MKKVLLLAFVAAMSVASCTNEKATLSKTYYTLYHSTTEEIQGTDIEGVEWASDNEFVATVSNGVIEGQYVGRTNVNSNKQRLSFTVDVKPKYNLYKEPDIDWGISKATIKSRYGEPTASSGDVLFYESGNSDVPLYGYMFKNDALYGSAVIVKVSSASTLASFLIERYLTIGVDMDKYTAYFMHCSGKIKDPRIDYAVGMSYSSSIGAIAVLYTNAENNNNTKNKKSDINGAFTKALIDAKIKL